MKSNTYSVPKVLFLASIGIATLITYLLQNNDFEKINNEVVSILGNKSSVSDYYCNTDEDGMLYDVYVNNANKNNPFFNTGYVRSEKRVLAYEPFKGPNDIDADYSKKLKQYNLFKNLTQYYEAKNDFVSSGFRVLSFEKNSDKFIITTSFSGDMAYMALASANFRPSINKCYEAAAKSVAEKGGVSYESGVYSKINEFKSLETKFYKLTQQYPKSHFSNDTLVTDYGKDYFGKESSSITYQADKNKITSLTGKNDAFVKFPNTAIVWFKSYSNSYEIKLKLWALLKYFLIYTAVCSTVLLGSYYWIKKPQK